MYLETLVVNEKNMVLLGRLNLSVGDFARLFALSHNAALKWMDERVYPYRHGFDVLDKLFFDNLLPILVRERFFFADGATIVVHRRKRKSVAAKAMEARQELISYLEDKPDYKALLGYFLFLQEVELIKAQRQVEYVGYKINETRLEEDDEGTIE